MADIDFNEDGKEHLIALKRRLSELECQLAKAIPEKEKSIRDEIETLLFQAIEEGYSSDHISQMAEKYYIFPIRTV